MGAFNFKRNDSTLLFIYILANNKSEIMMLYKYDLHNVENTYFVESIRICNRFTPSNNRSMSAVDGFRNFLIQWQTNNTNSCEISIVLQ